MSSYRIALNFEDGVTRFIDCKAGEKVLDAAFRQDQPADGLLRRRVRHLQVPRRERATTWATTIDDALSEDEAQPAWC
jgi:benzoate/toluate 1,2-dioxygenase reductase subunit